MNEQQLDGGRPRYEEMLLDLWEYILYYSTELHMTVSEGKRTRNAVKNPAALASNLIVLWEELDPLIEGTSLENEFKQYEDYCNNAAKLKNEPKTMLAMRRTLRKALDKAGITKTGGMDYGMGPD